jgi:hypothetical protein
MTKSFVLIIWSLLILSCTGGSQKEREKIDNSESTLNLDPTFDSLQLDDKVRLAIDSFVKSANCSNCINEIFVNKVYPDSTLITINSRAYSSWYLMHINSLFTTYLCGKLFYVYSGLEDILKGDGKYLHSEKDTVSKKFFIWTLVLRKDSIRIIKDGFYPFSNVKIAKVEMNK